MHAVCWILVVLGLVVGRGGAMHEGEKTRNRRHLAQISAEEQQALDELADALAPRSPPASPPPPSPSPSPREPRSPTSPPVTTAAPAPEQSPQQPPQRPSPPTSPQLPPPPPSPQSATATPAVEPSPSPVPSPSPQLSPPAGPPPSSPPLELPPAPAVAAPEQSPPLPPPSYPSNTNATVAVPGSPPLTPAPADFSRSSLPSFDFIGYGPGPVDVTALGATAPPGQCQALGAVLAAIPEASKWLSIIKNAGLESILLTDGSVRTTLLVPINSAFSAAIDARPLGREETTVDQLITNDGTLQTAMIGYSTLRGLWPASTLRPGTTLSTFASIDKVNPLAIQVGDSSQLQGIGSTSTVLQADIAACGPSVVHLVDQVLLPFRFDQGPIDAISGTQVNS